MPSVARPAMPSGSVASRAERITARRGMSDMAPVWSRGRAMSGTSRGGPRPSGTAVSRGSAGEVGPCGRIGSVGGPVDRPVGPAVRRGSGRRAGRPGRPGSEGAPLARHGGRSGPRRHVRRRERQREREGRPAAEDRADGERPAHRLGELPGDEQARARCRWSSCAAGPRRGGTCRRRGRAGPPGCRGRRRSRHDRRPVDSPSSSHVHLIVAPRSTSGRCETRLESTWMTRTGSHSTGTGLVGGA